MKVEFNMIHRTSMKVQVSSKATSCVSTLLKSPLLGFAQKGTVNNIIQIDQSIEHSAEKSFAEICSERNR